MSNSMQMNEYSMSVKSTFELLIPSGVNLYTEYSCTLPASSTELIFFHAVWSGSSIFNIKYILTKLKLDIVMNLNIYILNLDTLPLNIIKTYLQGKISHGNGEAVWIEDGEIVKCFTDKLEINEFVQFVNNQIH